MIRPNGQFESVYPLYHNFLHTMHDDTIYFNDLDFYECQMKFFCNLYIPTKNFADNKL